MIVQWNAVSACCEPQYGCVGYSSRMFDEATESDDENSDDDTDCISIATTVLLILLHKIQQLSTTAVARSASWLSVTHASRWWPCGHQRFCESCTNEVTRDVVVPSAALGLTSHFDFTNVQIF